MKEGTSEVNTGTELVDTAGKAFQDIAVLIIEVSDQVKDISTAIAQMAGGSQQIVSSVNEIDTVSKKTAMEAQTVSAATQEQSASMEEIAASSQTLAKMAYDLQEVVSHFSLVTLFFYKTLKGDDFVHIKTVSPSPSPPPISRCTCYNHKSKKYVPLVCCVLAIKQYHKKDILFYFL